MPRQPRQFVSGYCYHITVRCNNREFRLIRDECREILLYALERCKEKYGFKLYALCIMSNHVHYLLRPVELEFKIQSSKFKMEKPVQPITERIFAFAVRIVKLCQTLGATGGVNQPLVRQLIRSGTSVGANVEETQTAQSRADFIHKMEIALKELRETRYSLLVTFAGSDRFGARGANEGGDW